MIDSYTTIKNDSIGEFRDRGSKFIAYAFPVFSDEEIQQRLLEVQKQHPKSRHCCYAYRLGLDKNNYRANDDGEPSGTAGRPILGQIDSAELTYVLVAVIRYFGGTLLGTSGLINAYKTSASIALEAAPRSECIVSDVFEVTFNYAIMSDVMNAIKKNEVEIVAQDFGDIGKLQIAIRKSEVTQKMPRIRAQIAKVHLEEIATIETIEGLTIEQIGTR